MSTFNSYLDVLSENAAVRSPIGSWILVAILAFALIALA